MIKSAAKSGKTVHFSPVFGANRTTIRLKPVKNCPRLPLFSLRPIKPDRLLALIAVEPCSPGIVDFDNHPGFKVGNGEAVADKKTAWAHLCPGLGP